MNEPTIEFCLGDGDTAKRNQTRAWNHVPRAGETIRFGKGTAGDIPPGFYRVVDVHWDCYIQTVGGISGVGYSALCVVAHVRLVEKEP